MKFFGHFTSWTDVDTVKKNTCNSGYGIGARIKVGIESDTSQCSSSILNSIIAEINQSKFDIVGCRRWSTPHLYLNNIGKIWKNYLIIAQ